MIRTKKWTLLMALLLILSHLGCRSQEEERINLLESRTATYALTAEEINSYDIDIVKIYRMGQPALFALFEQGEDTWSFELADCQNKTDIESLFGIDLPEEIGLANVSDLSEYGITDEGHNSNVAISCAGGGILPMNAGIFYDMNDNLYHILGENDKYYAIPTQCEGVKEVFRLSERMPFVRTVTELPEGSTSVVVGCNLNDDTGGKEVEPKALVPGWYLQRADFFGCDLENPYADEEHEGEFDDAGVESDGGSDEEFGDDLSDDFGEESDDDFSDDFGEESGDDFSDGFGEDFGDDFSDDFGEEPREEPEWNWESDNAIIDVYLLSYVDIHGKQHVFPIYQIDGKNVDDYVKAHENPASAIEAVAGIFGATVLGDLGENSTKKLYDEGALTELPFVSICVNSCESGDYVPEHFIHDPLNNENQKIDNHSVVVTKQAQNRTSDDTWAYGPEKAIIMGDCIQLQNRLGLRKADDAVDIVQDWDEWKTDVFNAIPTEGAESPLRLRCDFDEICYQSVSTGEELLSAFASDSNCLTQNKMYFHIADNIVIDEPFPRLAETTAGKEIFMFGQNTSISFSQSSENCDTGVVTRPAMALCGGQNLKLEGMSILPGTTHDNAPTLAFETVDSTLLLSDMTVGNETGAFDYALEAIDSKIAGFDLNINANVKLFSLAGSKLLISSNENTNTLHVADLVRTSAVKAYLSDIALKNTELRAARGFALKSSTVEGRLVELTGGDDGYVGFWIYRPLSADPASQVTLIAPVISGYQAVAVFYDAGAVVNIMGAMNSIASKNRLLRNSGTIGSFILEGVEVTR